MNRKIFPNLVGVLLILAILFLVPGSSVAHGSRPGNASGNSILQNIQVIPGQWYYLNVPGTALRPRAGTTNWMNDTNGRCIYATNTGFDVFNVDIQLPEQAQIRYLRIYFYDTSASESSAWVTSYDGEGGYSDLLYVTSSGNAGYGTNLSAYTPVMVDNAVRSMVLNWRPYGTGTTMQLCGLRIAYRMPDYPVYLPTIIR